MLLRCLEAENQVGREEGSGPAHRNRCRPPGLGRTLPFQPPPQQSLLPGYPPLPLPPLQAVNFAPSHWIPYGTDVAEKYRTTGKPLTLRWGAGVGGWEAGGWGGYCVPITAVTCATRWRDVHGWTRVVVMLQHLPATGLSGSGAPASWQSSLVPPLTRAGPSCSHDALLVTLVKAAEHKPARLPTADGTDSDPACGPPLGGAGGDPQQQAEQQQQLLQAGSAAAWAAAAPGLPLPWEQPPPRSRSRSGAAAGQAPLLSPLGPAPLQRAPAEGIALAAGELSLRAAEERRRRMVAFVAVGMLPGGGHTQQSDATCNGLLWVGSGSLKPPNEPPAPLGTWSTRLPHSYPCRAAHGRRRASRLQGRPGHACQHSR